jgi:putative ABC transport system substrate-binding protein
VALLSSWKLRPATAPLRRGSLFSTDQSLSGRGHDADVLHVRLGRILKGEKPAKLPLQESIKFDLVINLKTAGALSLNVSRDFLLRADEVIQ